ncbi:histidine kinase family protein [Asticcacaulis biprosthecium C19]|uniref:Histidine kinase family protein n=1 Tax=Asticcacaulis biprosthecium C19 TaxID=715226 RepID=F4QJ83_9CAUL|nr:sensor histidine kinase [Asticcacaulis biprosthecium]EGF91914.1 histidine kinase family protein [Asticcacaulis biprosthecium C19]
MVQIKRRRFLGLALDGPTIWLSYLIMYVWPWFLEKPRHLDWQASLAALPVFLIAYYGSFDLRGRAAWPGIAVIAAISLGLGQLTAAASIIMLFAVMIAVQSQRGRPRYLWLGGLAAATILAVAIGWVSWIFGFGVLFFGGLAAAATAANSLLQDQTEELIRARAQAEALAVMGERERISRDLHDIVGHAFSTVVLKSDLASRVIDGEPERARSELEAINAVGREALQEIRSAIRGLNQSTLIAATGHVRALLEAADIQLTFSNTAGPLPPPLEHAVAMVMREAVTNVVRHAGATACTIDIRRDHATLCLEIRDDGRGGTIVFGNGLDGISRRGGDLGGTVAIEAAQGVTVAARFPVGAPS